MLEHVITVVLETEASPAETVRILKDAMRLRDLRVVEVHHETVCDLSDEDDTVGVYD